MKFVREDLASIIKDFIFNKMIITKENVHEFSKHYKKCKNRKTKSLAKLFIKCGAIEYDKENKVYLANCSFAQYKIKWIKGKFVCNCGFEDCHHVLALYMQLKMWNSEIHEPTEKNISAEVID